ncbi:MAG: ABC transporter permease [Acidimicrobiia bacterium]|nr:ABC transporter permease [Acidimicrobiia bacterium]
MVWIGASNSVREIVKERTTFLRERAVGVSPSSLVASRWVVLSLITVLQAFVLYATATSRQRTPLTDGVLLDSGRVELILAFALVGLASVGVGLGISGIVADSNKAMAALPIVLIPVVLFSGLLIPTAGKIGLEQVSYLNPIQWGSSAAATTVDVLAREGCNPTGLEAQLQQAFLGRTISCSNPRWQTTEGTQAVNLALAFASLVILVAVSFWTTTRSTRVIRI